MRRPPSESKTDGSGDSGPEAGRSSGGSASAYRRGVRPVIATVLMVVLTVLLASVFAAGWMAFDAGAGEKRDQFEEVLTEKQQTLSGNPWAGNRDALIQPADDRAGATDVTYRVNFTIRPGSDTVGNSLNSVYVEVTSGSPDMFSNTQMSDLDQVVIDENSDGTIDREITSDVDAWQPQNGGSALKIGFTGSAYTADADDSIIVVFEGVDNPNTAGSYDVRAETSGDGNYHYGTIEIT